jgi:hypothetical protein
MYLHAKEVILDINQCLFNGITKLLYGTVFDGNGDLSYASFITRNRVRSGL